MMQNHNHNAALLNRGDIAHDITSKKTSDVLNKDYKKAYESTKAKAEYEKVLKDAHGMSRISRVTSIDRDDLTWPWNSYLGIKHTLDVTKNVIDATNSKYSQDAKQQNATNEFTKSFCDTDQYKTSKKITEITRKFLNIERSWKNIKSIWKT